MLDGNLERVDRFGVCGWAPAGSVLRVLADGRAVAGAAADIARADLPDGAAGFAAWFAAPLTADCSVSVDSAAGALPGGPWLHRAACPPGAWRPDAGPRLALVLDAATPDAARDAGSAALLSHMQALRDLGYAVRFATLDAADAALRDTAGRVRLAYLHRLSAAAWLPQVRAANPGVRVIFAVADLQHLRAARQAAVLGGAIPPGLRAAELTAAREADAVLTHSPVEAALLRASLPGLRAAVVPWAAPRRALGVPFAARGGVGFIGSYGHAPNLDAARVLLDEVMPLVWREQPIACVLAGSAMPGWLRARAGGLVRVLPDVPDAGDFWRQIRVSAAPLRFGAGVKGKVLDSLAAGVPCVCSRVAAEGVVAGGLALPGVLRADGVPAMAAALLHLHEDAAANAAAAAAGAAGLADAAQVAAALAAIC